MKGLPWLTPLRAEQLEAAVRFSLPPAYNFEINKTLQRLHEATAKRVCLQLPEGLMVWAEALAHIIQEFGDRIDSCVIMGDVTYGACCVDDIKARHLMERDFLIHYSHSCLVPMDTMNIRCLYIFVEIDLDAERLVAKLIKSLPAGLADTDTESPSRESAIMRRNIAVLGTIQFSKCVHTCAQLLRDEHWQQDNIFVPQQAPLSAGETLGCTSVVLPLDTDFAIFIADGRFHVESAMIQNPHCKFYRYDPFTERLFAESYDLERMLSIRSSVICRARSAASFVIILSTLGRQGCTGIVEHLERLLRTHRGEDVDVTVLLLAELNPKVISDMAGDEDVCFINVGCPRLSIDWGAEYKADVITSFELVQALTSSEKHLSSYPMDYFSADGGEWSNGPHRKRKVSPAELRKQWLQKKRDLLLKPQTAE